MHNNINLIITFTPYINLENSEKATALSDAQIRTKYNIALKKLNPFYSGDYYYLISGEKQNISDFCENFLHTSLSEEIANNIRTLKTL